jgi:hypothetical protein
MRKFFAIVVALVVISTICYFSFSYYAKYSEGDRSGELIKFSYKGFLFKTYEGDLSQGISGSQIFSFSVLDSQEKVISEMKNLEGHYVRVTYIERYKTFPWWGDSKYFITAVKEEKSPFKIK